MIKYNLKCFNDHEFESWFSDSIEFDNLKKKNLLECIFCSSKKINKSIMSPMISGIKEQNNEIKMLRKNLQNNKNKLLQLRKFVEKNFEYVGENFSKRVREVYYDNKNEKTIYGITTQEERKELEEEGIDLLSVPWINKDN
jgi:hypothetical protein|tara:strand:- start:666 stop:1088 length:423 start_codon:yes stop_codon:yes gene_type:complete